MTERGFTVTSTEEVMARVGVPKGSFYYHFGSKAAYGQAVIDAYAVYFETKLDRILTDRSFTPIDRLRNFVTEATEGLARYAFKRGCLVGNLGQELASMDDVFRRQLEKVLASWQKRFAQCLREAIEVSQLPKDADVDALAEFFWIGWEGAIMRAKLQKSAIPLDRFAEIFFSKVIEQQAVTKKKLKTAKK
ncbi:Transcriptional regulator AcuR [Afipia felis]